MKRFSLPQIFLMVSCCWGGVVRANDYRDAAAVDLAISTMVDAAVPQPGPSPAKCSRCKGTGWTSHGDGHRTPCPDCQNGSSNQYGNPLDTLRDAKSLIAKGNALADRGKVLLDAAEVEGKISVDIRLPKTLRSAKPAESKPTDSGMCPNGVCPWMPKAPPQTSPDVTTPANAGRRMDWGHRLRLFGRFRR